MTYSASPIYDGDPQADPGNWILVRYGSSPTHLTSTEFSTA
ncbi:hypothetical protein [Chamaesiphon sp.]